MHVRKFWTISHLIDSLSCKISEHYAKFCQTGLILLRRSFRIFLPPFKKQWFWLINLEKIDFHEIEKAKTLLNSNDLKGSLPLVFEEDRYRSALIYAIVKYHLGLLLDQPPQKLTLQRNEFGKPYLQGYPLHFNISHTKSYAFLGIHLSKQIGVDIEEINHEIFEGIESFLFPYEKQWLFDCFKNPNEGALALWCAKEALLKAIGIGFSANPIPRFICIEKISEEIHRLKGTAHYFLKDTEVYVYNEVLTRHKIAVAIL
jgi:phosphopantetheinyl transferase